MRLAASAGHQPQMAEVKPSSQDTKQYKEKKLAVPGRERIYNQWVPQNQIHKCLNLKRKGQHEILPSSLNQALQTEI